MNDDDKNLNNSEGTVEETTEETTNELETSTGEDMPVEQAGLLESGEETNNDANEETSDESQASEDDKDESDLDEESEDEGNDSDESEESADDDSAEEVEDDADEEEVETSEKADGEASDEPASTDDPNAKWYVVHTYSGHENKVAATLKQRVESEHLEAKIFQVLVPMQDKIEIKGGKKAEVKEKIFPGYILVKMVLEDNTWLVVRTTQGVTSFVGMGNKPTPIPDSEVQSIIKFTQIQQPTFKQVFTSGDTVKIVDGPFAEFIGKVDNVDEEKGKVKVLVSIFGRETPVELDFLQVQKI